MIDTCCEMALRRMSLELTDHKSTLVQVMAWCRQATSHYLSQCWPSFLSPYGVTRPWWGNIYQGLDKMAAILQTTFCQHCSNYIFILNLTPGFNGLGIDNCKMRWETFEFWDLVCLTLEAWGYIYTCINFKTTIINWPMWNNTIMSK